MASPAFGKALSAASPVIGVAQGPYVQGTGGGKNKKNSADSSLPVVQGVPVTSPRPTPTGYPTLAGMELWIPPQPNVYQDGLPVYEIIGQEAQIVQFPLRPGRQIMCFSGAMCYMSDGMNMTAQLTGLMRTFGRVAGGGSIFQMVFSNDTNTDGYIAMSPDYPGVVVPINMRDCPSGKIVAMRDSFLCSTVGIGEAMCQIGAGFNPASSVGGFCCSGVDFIVQTVSHGEWCFLMGMGTVITKTLASGEKMIVDTDSILCFESSVGIDIQWIGSVAACCCGGEGLFNTTVTGPGKIWIQSMGIDKMRRLFPPNVQKSGGGVEADAGN